MTRAALIAYVGGFGLDLPPSWSGFKDVGSTDRPRASTMSVAEDDIGTFLAKEKHHLQALQLGHMTGARAARTFASLRIAAIKLLWFCASTSTPYHQRVRRKQCSARWPQQKAP